MDDSELLLPVERGGDRLDRFLAARLGDASRAEVQRWVKDGRITIGGRPVKSSYKLAAGEVVHVLRPPRQETVIRAEAIPLDIVYEDGDLLVVNKPGGMVVHPAPGHSHGTLVNALLAHDPALAEIGGPERAGIVHRLDRDTSGLLVVARQEAAYIALQAQFKARQVRKIYLALVEGFVEVAEGQIEAPVGRDPVHRKRMAVRPGGRAKRGGRAALTLFRVLAFYEPQASTRRQEFSLLELDLRTGRTHQIRVHLAFIKHPVVGDRIYGRRRQAIACPRQFLHASGLQLQQPTTGQAIALETPLPDDLQAVLDSLRPVPAGP